MRVIIQIRVSKVSKVNKVLRVSKDFKDNKGQWTKGQWTKYSLLCTRYSVLTKRAP